MRLTNSEINQIEDSLLENDQENAHILHFWQPFSFEIDDSYSFLPHGILFSLLSSLLYGIAWPILAILNKLIFGFTIHHRDNIKNIKGGKITVSNHVHPMDCTMNGLANFPSKVYFPTLSSNFKIPIVRHLIYLLQAIPIPEDNKYLTKWASTIHQLLHQGKTVHFYPEGSLWPYYSTLRRFKNGAFRLSVENKVPIVPIVYSFVKPYGIWKYMKKKPCIHATILDAIYPDPTLPFGEAINTLKEQVFLAMKQELEKNHLNPQ